VHRKARSDQSPEGVSCLGKNKSSKKKRRSPKREKGRQKVTISKWGDEAQKVRIKSSRTKGREKGEKDRGKRDSLL